MWTGVFIDSVCICISEYVSVFSAACTDLDVHECDENANVSMRLSAYDMLAAGR